MHGLVRIGLALLAAASLAAPARAADEDPIENARLPKLWKVESRAKIPADQVAALSRKLGIEMTSLENDLLDAGGIRLQVNLARCPDEERAEALWRKFTDLHGGEEDHAGHFGGSLYAARRGVEVAEIVCANRQVAQKAQHVIGWNDILPRRHTGLYHRVAMRVAPLESCDGMRWNRMFNLLARADGADDATASAEIVAETKAFVFADRVLLPRDGLPGVEPRSASSRPVGDAVELTFEALPRRHGVPVLTVKEDVPVETFRPAPTTKDAGPWTGATEAWPIDAPAVRAAVAAALGRDPPSSPRERVERVLAWMHDHVRYGGDETGSRYGVVKVLEQGFGHCWDQSDVFVTLCRAANVPARQAGGWLLRAEGHVWAEVRLGEEGDLAVDPGTTWLGVSSDYVRLWVSDDGRTPFVYWAAPKIESFVCIR